MPAPRVTRIVVDVAFVAGSVEVTLIVLAPLPTAMRTRNAPVLSAVADPVAWFVVLTARIVLLAWVRPFTWIEMPFTVAPLFGEVMVSFGLEVSRT